MTVTKPVKVYNLTLDTENVYYANGILVANCADALALAFYPSPGRIRQETKTTAAKPLTAGLLTKSF